MNGVSPIGQEALPPTVPRPPSESSDAIRMQDSCFQVDETSIGDGNSTEARVAAVEESDRDALRRTLGYLYLKDGPLSIARDSKTQAEQYLTPVELFVLRWLYKRTDGKLRRFYGPATLEAVRRSRYRCEKCGFADVRALNTEKADCDKEAGQIRFACLCANCNTVEARAKEMAAIVSNEERAAQADDEHRSS